MNPDRDLRNTIQRELVYEEVMKADDHPVAETIYERIHASHPSLSRSTVYRNLKLLAEEGKIRSLSVPSGPVHFDRTLEAHYHIQCTRCGKVCDVTVAEEGNARLLYDAGFQDVRRMVIYQGICPTCQKHAET